MSGCDRCIWICKCPARYDARECVSLWISPGVFVYVSGMEFTFVWSYGIMCLDLCA